MSLQISLALGLFQDPYFIYSVKLPVLTDRVLFAAFILLLLDNRRVFVNKNFTDHYVVPVFLLTNLSQFVVDGEPHTVVSINDSTTDFNRDLVEEDVTNVAGPGYGTTSVGGKRRKIDLEVGLVNQITITRNKARNLATEVGVSSKGLFHRLHGEVGVTTVHNTEECDLWGSRDVNILRSICSLIPGLSTYFI